MSKLSRRMVAFDPINSKSLPFIHKLRKLGFADKERIWMGNNGNTASFAYHCDCVFECKAVFGKIKGLPFCEVLIEGFLSISYDLLTHESIGDMRTADPAGTCNGFDFVHIEPNAGFLKTREYVLIAPLPYFGKRT